jgi:hypothetical protein
MALSASHQRVIPGSSRLRRADTLFGRMSTMLDLGVPPRALQARALIVSSDLRSPSTGRASLSLLLPLRGE